MIYPVYSAPLSGEGGSVGRTIKSPPLLRMKFVNLIQSADGMGDLLGCIEGVNFKPNLEPGVFTGDDGDIFPKSFDISFRFTPQHEATLGWETETNQFITDTFPYSANNPGFDIGSADSGGNQSLDASEQDRALE